MKHILWLPLFALLALVPGQNAFAAEKSRDFGVWEKEISAFEKSDATNPPPKGALLFAGSSTIRYWTTLAKDFPEHRVINRGFGGSQIIDSTHFADRIIIPYAPSAIFFRAGGNDIAADKSPEQVFTDFKDFVATVHRKLPDTEINFMSWNPTILRWENRDKEKTLNNLIEEFAKTTPHVKYIDIYNMSLGANGEPRPDIFRSDKLHFNAEGYKLLAAALRPYLPKPTESTATTAKP